MNHRFSDDRDIQRSFDALRDADLEGAPGYRTLLRRPRATESPRSTIRLAGAWAAGGLALAAAVAGVMILFPARHADVPLDNAISQAQEMSSWSAPTDTFLEVDSLDSRSEPPADRP
ncbi:MAG TPA: hypothetical protein VMR65_11865 [Candidatus Sulfotelmatobacter sp.]|jgi:hypothetical protein|nr:hypothetical protein [Candidatus Sulfotelmatobacter sp.]